MTHSLFHRVIGRHLEEVRRGLRRTDIRELIHRVAKTRVTAFCQNVGLQLRRIPALRSNSYWPGVADFASGDRFRNSRALSRYAFDHLRSQRLGGRLPFGTPLKLGVQP